MHDEFAEQVLDLANTMLQQWGEQVIEAWIGIFAKLLPVLAKSENGAREQQFI